MELKVKIDSFCYGKKQVLKNIDFTAKSGFTAIIGKNGSGKSTLLSCIDRILSFDGEITLNGENISSFSKKELARKISMMHQIPNLPHIKVKELVGFGRSPYLKIGQSLSEKDNEIIENAITKAYLEDIKDCFLDRISGGESRRAYLGMMLSQNTEIMLLDEATAFMDKDKEKQFISLLKKISKEENKIVIFAMHDLSLALSAADNVLLLDENHQVFFGEKEKLYESGLIEKIFSVEKYTAFCGEKEKIFYQ